MQKKISIGVSTVKLDTTKLDAIERELGKKMVARVGVLGAKAEGRQVIHKKEWVTNEKGKLKNVTHDSPLSNAEIGLIHEKGSKSGKIPRRSFIEMPLQLKLPRIVAKIGQAAIDALTKENVKVAYKKLGILGENIIQGAFASRGYGRWAANTKATIARKGSSAPLIDTAQLRRSITSTVVTK